ncbi:Pep2 [Cupriavidus basilensis OR16]|uniref:Pep2 n=1 Tax=Cupriavidus basilensis OR16 TaxID=1127483 RepID=H1SB60_9BURK|nr:LysR family transcriptional regulator [Cupriavidus basilensis]EHP40298.1 Pep2 [Cupriavidus basilensis OR16]
MATPDWDQRIGRRLKLRDLHILSVVAHWGSMAKAATHLAMTQPAISESIANLESVLCVRLLDRGPRGVTPTIYAQVLLRRGHVVFDELHQGLKEIEFLARPTAGDVRVAAGDTMAAGLLPAAIDKLSLRYPAIVVRVAQASVERMDFRELRERTVDVALARVPRAFEEDDLDCEILFDDPHRVVVGAKSPWATRRKVSLAQMVNEPWLFASNQMIRELIEEAFKAHGLDVPREAVVGSSILMRNQLLATGRFVTVLPESVLRYNARQWALKALPVDLGVAARCVAVVTLKNRTVSPVAELFVQHVREAAREIASPFRPTKLVKADGVPIPAAASTPPRTTPNRRA